MAYEDFTDLSRRTTSDKVLKDEEFNIARKAKYDGYQRDFASMAYKLFDKKTSGGVIKSISKSASFGLGCATTCK